MLLPALARAKSRAYAANDINNCKQTMLACNLYCSDNTDVLPAPGWQMGYDTWACSANLALLNSHSAGTFQNDYNTQLHYFLGDAAPALGKPAELYQFLRSPKLLICPEDRPNPDYYLRYELITSYVFDGAIVGFGEQGQTTINTPSGSYYKPDKISAFKATNILEWENDEKNISAGNINAWNDVANFPLENGKPAFSLRHGKASQVGRMDGSAARIAYAEMLSQAQDNNNKNDLWYNPLTPTGH